MELKNFTDMTNEQFAAHIKGLMEKPRTASRLRERNMKVQQRLLENGQEIKSFREGFKRRFKGLDPLDAKKLPFMEEGFSWKKCREKVATVFREADVSSAFTQFLRAGVQVLSNDGYINADTTFEDWVRVVPSKMAFEPYAPMHGVAFPRQVASGVKAPEVGAAALDLQIRNLDYAAMYVVEKNLIEDDQTGQFNDNSRQLGEYLHLLYEVLCYGKLASVSNMKYADYDIPKSETKPSGEANYPWSTSLIGGGKTRPTTYAVLGQVALQAAFIALHNQKNLQGLKMAINPNRLIIGTAYQFDAAVLLNSSYYPTGATAGATGGAFSINPLKALAEITVTKFMFKNDGTVDGDSLAWQLTDDKKAGFVLQQRQAATVEQEAPNSGSSFELRQYRFQGTMRGNADFIDPRFFFQGNDGSVTS